MRKHFDDQIAQLGEQMMAMGALVENTIERAIRALQTDDMAEAAAIRDGDHVVDEKEREVEAMCIHMLLQQQPVARDLRTISAALKMITDMERIGDQASDICEIATMGHLRSPRPEHFASMAQAAPAVAASHVPGFRNWKPALAPAGASAQSSAGKEAISGKEKTRRPPETTAVVAELSQPFNVPAKATACPLAVKAPAGNWLTLTTVSAASLCNRVCIRRVVSCCNR